MRANRHNKGIALLLVVGILTIFTVTFTTFAVNMQLERKAAQNYANSIRVRYFSEAAVEYVIAILKSNFKTTIIDSLSESWATGAITLNFDDGYTNVVITDEQAKVNINNASLLLLSNLPSIGSTIAQRIIDYRNSSNFATKEEVKRVSGIGDATYSSIKDLITVNSFIDSNRQNRSPININTASSSVLVAVFNGVSDGTSIITSLEAQDLATELIDARPFNSWAELNSAIDTSALITSDKKSMIKELFNSYLRLPSPAPSNFTTEFCLFSGCFSINAQSTFLNKAGISVASSEVEAIVSLFSDLSDAAFITTYKEDFRGEDADYDGVLDSGEDTNSNGTLDIPTYDKVTWFDSCPVNSSDDLGLTYRQDLITYPDYGYETIGDALKLGFWDNFDEDEDYSSSEWIQDTGSYSITNCGYGSKSSSDKQLFTTSAYSKFTLFDLDKWSFTDEFSMRLYSYDAQTPIPGDGCENVGNMEFSNTSGGLHKVFINRFGFYYMGMFGRQDISGDGVTEEITDFMDVLFHGCLFPDAVGGLASKLVTSNYDVFVEEKAYKIVSTGLSQQPSYFLGFDTTGFDPVSEPWENNRYDYPNFFPPTSGVGWLLDNWRLSFYMNSSITAWDDIRIIPSYGSYTSIPFSLADNSILEWGTISGTVTIPTTANSVSETVMFETSTDGGTNFSSSGLGGGAILESPSQSILYRVNLSSIDLDYSETPVLEDVTLTFLKPNNVRTVYYKQIAE